MKIPYKYRILGFNYVLLNIPFLWWGKVGFTGKLKGVGRRAQSTSEAAPGILIPVMVCILPAPWFIEQAVLWLLAPFRAKYYRGDGHTEAVNIGGVVVAWLLYGAIWLIYIEIAFQNGFSPVGAMEVLEWVLFFIKNVLQKI